MGSMTPRDLNENPKQLLNIPHELHKDVLRLQETLFPGFGNRFKDAKVHCFECDGVQPFVVFVKSTNEMKLCVGYAGDIENDLDHVELACRGIPKSDNDTVAPTLAGLLASLLSLGEKMERRAQ